MKWIKGVPKEDGIYLVRFVWKDEEEVVKEVGIGRFRLHRGWVSVEDFDGEWSGSDIEVTGWHPMPSYEGACA